MNLSYWEYKSWLSHIDFAIIGSGIVGLSTALELNKRYPTSKIVILEKGVFPQGASTKNAGFACFGSISELLDDLKTHTEKEVLDLVRLRVEGLQILRARLGDEKLGFKLNGGYELFSLKDKEAYDSCMSSLGYMNQLLAPLFETSVFSTLPNKFKFGAIQPSYIHNQFEAQIDTGQMMIELVQLAQSQGILIINNCCVETFMDDSGGVNIKTSKLEFKSKKLFITTNGFSNTLIQKDLKPARAQVLITKPIENLAVQGTFHLDRGYYYFRNIDHRILLGGGRHLDFEGEQTSEFALSQPIQDNLDHLLSTVILPETPYEIERRWTGIMGVGTRKLPIVEQLSDHVFCGVRMGGMGVALGSCVGRSLSNLV